MLYVLLLLVVLYGVVLVCMCVLFYVLLHSLVYLYVSCLVA